MATETKIQWTDSTFNPWRGCTKIASGCANCYADTLAKRNPKTLGIWGPNGTRVLASPAMWKEPVKWNAEAEANGETHRVFCASLADIFEDWQGEVSLTAKDFGRGILSLDDIRAELFKLIDATPHLTWQILTKRPENIRRMWGGIDAERHSINIQCGNHGQYRRNVHLLYSASDQQSLEAGIGELLKCRDLVPVLGLSLEPLVGPITFRWASWQPIGRNPGDKTDQLDGLRKLDWVIVGGESGPNARPFDLAWARSIVSQCRAAGVPVFVKQLGEQAYDSAAREEGNEFASYEQWVNKAGSWLGGVSGAGYRYKKPEKAICVDAKGRRCQIGSDFMRAEKECTFPVKWHYLIETADKKGGDWSEWPEDLRVREFPKH